jgi:hypothetical protein
VRNESPVIVISAVVKGAKPQPIATDRILSLAYEDSDTKSDKLTLTVLNHDLRAFDSPVFRAGMRLIVQWGYWHNMCVPREVVVKSVKGFTTLTVVCYDKGSLLGEKKKTSTFKNMTRSEVVTAIALAYDYPVEQRFITLTTRTFGAIAYGGMTDGELVAKLAKEEGFQFYIDVDGFHWHERDFAQKPVRTFSWGAPRSSAEAIIDDPEIDVDLTVPRPKYIRAKGIDRETGKPFSVEANNAVTERTGLASTLENLEDWSAKVPAATDAGGAAASLEDESAFGDLVDGLLGGSETPDETDDATTLDAVDQRDGTTQLLLEAAALEAGSEEIADDTSHDATDAKTKVDARFKKLVATTVKLKFSALGDPSFFGKRVFRFVCQAPGAPPCKRLSGNYYAKTVSHDVTPGSYTMKIEAISDGGNGHGKKSKASVNTQAPKDADGQSAEEASHELEEIEVVDERDGETRTVYN